MNIIDVGRGRAVDPKALGQSLTRALSFYGTPTNAASGNRWDSAGQNVDFATDGPSAIDRWRVDHCDKLVQSYVQDSFPSGAAGFPRDFEHIRAKVWEEVREPLTAMKLFPMDTEIPVGARTHTARRIVGGGEATIDYRAGMQIGRAHTARVEEQFQTAWVVCAVDQNVVDGFAQNFAGLSDYRYDLREARRLVDEALNTIAWKGIPGKQMYGAIEYPSLGKFKSSQSFAAGAGGEAMVQALNDALIVQRRASGGAMRSNAVAVSPEVNTRLATTRHSDSSDLTALEYFLRTQPANGIKSIEEAPELTNAGGDGVDGIFFFKKDLNSIAHVLPQQPTIMPVYQSGPLDMTTVVIAQTGGIVQGDVGNNILMLVDVV